MLVLWKSSGEARKLGEGRQAERIILIIHQTTWLVHRVLLLNKAESCLDRGIPLVIVKVSRYYSADVDVDAPLFTKIVRRAASALSTPKSAKLHA